MKKTKLAVFFLGLLVAAFCLMHGSANASGFAVYTVDQTATAQGMSVVAHTDSPATIFFNPALMNTLKGLQVSMSYTAIVPSRKFQSDITGNQYNGVDNTSSVPSFFVTQSVNDKLSWGIGVFSPFGLQTNWGDTWEGRYTATKNELLTINVNPAISLKVVPNLSVAVGADILYGDAHLGKMLNLSTLGLPDAGQIMKADGMGYGFNVGAAWDPTKNITVGAAYRSRIRLDLYGSVTNSLPAVTPGQIAALFPSTSGSADITLPDQCFFGVAYKGIDKLKVEVGGKWEGWSSYKELDIRLQQPIAFATQSITPKNWHDIWMFNIGAEYQIIDALSLMAGYLWQGNPIPDSTFEASVPDNGSSVYSVGLKYQIGKLWASPSYAYQHVYTRTKNNTVDGNPPGEPFDPATSANGTYKTNLQIIGLSVGYLF